MKTGERWHCMNLACRHEIVVEFGGPEEGAAHVCECGSAMKKDYKPPVFRYLEFLKLQPEEAQLASADGEK